MTLPVIIWTNHKNLTYWSKLQKVGLCAVSWQVKLQQYNYKLQHKPGDQNKADALSCCPDYTTTNPNNDHLIVLPANHFINLSRNPATAHLTCLDNLHIATLTFIPTHLTTTTADDLNQCIQQAQQSHLTSL